LNWFTSDLHINHENIRGYCNRPFSSNEEMNEEMVRRWNERVCSDDTVYVVGDMFLGKPENAAPIIRRLNGKKILVLGNHDRSPRTMKECGFDEVWQRKNIQLLNGKHALLCHKPLPESTLQHVDLQIHGHRHSGPIVSGKRVNVCVDLWGFSPISEETLCSVKIETSRTDYVAVEVTEEFVKVTAAVRKEDYEGLIDHLQGYCRTIWNTRNDM
jgi:calcineurin-like phosphoesterase family protein